MEDIEIVNLWKQYSKKLDESLVLNTQHAADITKMKVQSFLNGMKPLKIFTVLLGFFWVGFLDVLIIHLFNTATSFFLVSATILSLLNKLAIGIYLYQLILIYQADINQPVLATQDKLARLKSSTLWIARILFLQLPLWTTFYLTTSMFTNGNNVFYIVQISVTLLFTLAAFWLFFNIRFENKDRKWFRLIFNGNEWTPVMKSMELLDQVREYRSEIKNSDT
ncbi:MAG: hypothetical protein ABIQ88_20915 [Chitinophagaceae bacterium]